MQYTTLIRKKNNSYQYIVTYKDDENKWKTKSKQGFPLNKAGKEKAKRECDIAVIELKNIAKNEISEDMIGITFEKFAEQYIKHMSLYREPNTILAFKTVANHFRKINDIELCKVSLADIQEVVDDMTRIGLNSNTIHDYLRKLNTILRSAMEDHNLISYLPTKKIKISKIKEETIKRALNKKESENLLKAFRKSQYYLVILISLKCGLRLGEILGLTWDDIDEVNHIIKVNKQWKRLKNKPYGFGTLKSKNSYRDVPISPATLALLNNSTKVRSINGRILNFKSTASTSVCLNRSFGLGNYNITIHELRHYVELDIMGKTIDFSFIYMCSMFKHSP